MDFYVQTLKGKEEEIKMLKDSSKEFNNNDSVKVRYDFMGCHFG